ncbi:MAG: hypothetical protein PHI27_01810 [Eubacteriales bacterium]|nr:hypothetical protein [Eubacteriales bacterium]MDD3880967.1 hypothetical protein [Eubacteriales bacterium]MDD4511964.1 hypothetical protein [Eubacteriales bacterium]
MKVYLELLSEYSTYKVSVLKPSDEVIAEKLGVPFEDVKVKDDRVYSANDMTIITQSYCSSIDYRDKSESKYTALTDTINSFGVASSLHNGLQGDYCEILLDAYPEEFQALADAVYLDPEAAAFTVLDITVYNDLPATAYLLSPLSLTSLDIRGGAVSIARANAALAISMAIALAASLLMTFVHSRGLSVKPEGEEL